ncbi:heme-degrading monooxygenase HmoA [Georgenia soli]|uniref:Heme-degrading monooxygenase HmoA n=1 Tax=Georgenia soli TaxID=638953 RepID=A0A2A9EMR3_9MICO|nr:antibiotic biosynthesis monooxygenase family protein [Georgenia soli]PFG39896.1 heme-degrading monooxygenase HmoA [Georgenia soli]
MSIVKINAITVPADSGDELAHRFAARAGAMEGVDGFLGFELLRPTDERTTWLVITRWRDEFSYEAWRGSDAFAVGHGRGGQADAGAGAGAGARHEHGGHSEGGENGGEPSGGHGHGGRRPVGTSAELWSFEIAGGSGVD